MTIEKIIKHLEYLKIAAEIDAKPESINAEIIGAAIEVIKERLTNELPYGTYKALAKVCVDNALRAATIEIAGEGEMPVMEFMERVSNGEYYVIRAKDNEIKPLPYEGEEAEDEQELKEYAKWLPQYEGKWVAESEAEDDTRKGD